MTTRRPAEKLSSISMTLILTIPHHPCGWILIDLWCLLWSQLLSCFSLNRCSFHLNVSSSKSLSDRQPGCLDRESKVFWQSWEWSANSVIISEHLTLLLASFEHFWGWIQIMQVLKILAVTALSFFNRFNFYFNTQFYVHSLEWMVSFWSLLLEKNVVLVIAESVSAWAGM